MNGPCFNSAASQHIKSPTFSIVMLKQSAVADRNAYFSVSCKNGSNNALLDSSYTVCVLLFWTRGSSNLVVGRQHKTRVNADGPLFTITDPTVKLKLEPTLNSLLLTVGNDTHTRTHLVVVTVSSGSPRQYTDYCALKSWGQPVHLCLPSAAAGTNEILNT